MNLVIYNKNYLSKGMLVHGVIGVVGQLAMPAVDLVQLPELVDVE